MQELLTYFLVWEGRSGSKTLVHSIARTIDSPLGQYISEILSILPHYKNYWLVLELGGKLGCKAQVLSLEIADDFLHRPPTPRPHTSWVRGSIEHVFRCPTQKSELCASELCQAVHIYSDAQQCIGQVWRPVFPRRHGWSNLCVTF